MAYPWLGEEGNEATNVAAIGPDCNQETALPARRFPHDAPSVDPTVVDSVSRR